MYDFYTNEYHGQAISREDFPHLAARAGEKLSQYCRDYRVQGDDRARSMAICAMAEALDYFDAALNGQGGLRYASVGTVSVSGKGIYSQVDISPAARERELYRCACRYLTIYRGA
jgi:hypothetical protein